MAVVPIPGKRPADLGVNGGRLAPCPASPNCVCSDDADAQHGVAPLRFAAAAGESWAAARQAVLSLPRSRVLTESADYLHAECASAFFGFVDDLELHLRPREGIIAVRSASRVGYSDFGVNRRRIETIRSALAAMRLLR
jgi:uncharacterized protein (DUF1499 family)